MSREKNQNDNNKLLVIIAVIMAVIAVVVCAGVYILKNSESESVAAVQEDAQNTAEAADAEEKTADAEAIEDTSAENEPDSEAVEETETEKEPDSEAAPVPAQEPAPKPQVKKAETAVPVKKAEARPAEKAVSDAETYEKNKKDLNEPKETVPAPAPVPAREEKKPAQPPSFAEEEEDDIDYSAVERIIKASSPAVKRCYDKALISNPQLSGRINVAITINEQGRVGNIKIKEDTINDDEVLDCVKGVIGRLRFPKPKNGSVTVTFPFAFSK